MTPDQVFRALGDPVRLQIVTLLSERDGQALFELCTRLMSSGTSITRQGVAKHLVVLVDAELIRVEREGRISRHYLQNATLADARDRLVSLTTTPTIKEQP